MAERAAVPVAVKFSVALSDGSFESHVSVPLTADADEKQRAVMRWMEIMQFGLTLPGQVDIRQSVEPS